MDLKKAETLVKSLMGKHIPSDKHNWRFEFDNATRRFGCCHCGGRKGYFISLSRKLVELNDESQVLDTILHEIAHAMDFEERGDTDHGPNWKRLAISIGCNGKRCYSSLEVIQPQSKYTTKCNTCGNEGKKMKKPRSSSVACGKCCKKHSGGKYDPKYILEYITNY